MQKPHRESIRESAPHSHTQLTHGAFPSSLVNTPNAPHTHTHTVRIPPWRGVCVSLPEAQHINLYNALKEKAFSHR